MVNLSVCIEMFWKDESFESRVRRAAELGFKHIEFWGWKNKDMAALHRTAVENDISIGAFCMESDRKLVEPDAESSLRTGLEESIAAARDLGADRLIVTTGNERKAETFEITRRTVVRNLKALLPILEKHEVTICLEPLNPIVNHIGYWLTTMSAAADICREVDSPWVKILMDIYHQQVTEGNIIANLRQYAPFIGHYHCAGVPGRHELAGGELDYRSIFSAITDTGFTGLVGLEFSPELSPEAALEQAVKLNTL